MTRYKREKEVKERRKRRGKKRWRRE
jgi:hypothetical protein